MKKEQLTNIYLGSRTFTEAALKNSCNKIPSCVWSAWRRAEAERAALIAGGFFFLFFWFCADCRAWSRLSKKNPPTSRCDVPSASTGLDPTDKNISTNVQVFFFLSWTNWTLPQHFPACFYSNLQLHHSDFTSPRKLSSSILAGSDGQLVLKKACFSMAWSVDWWRKQAKEVDCSVTP